MHAQSGNASLLNALSVLYLIFGCLGMLGFFLQTAWFAWLLGELRSTGGFHDFPAASGMETTEPMFTMVAIIFAIVLLATAALSMAMVVCGLALRRRQSRGLIYALAIISMLVFPVGTVLGMLTIYAFNDPATRQIFDYSRVDDSQQRNSA